MKTTIFALAVSGLSLAQQPEQTKLFPGSTKPKHDSATVVSTEQRVGDVVYQVFHPRNAPKREAFRVDIGFYDHKQLMKVWNYGLIKEKDMNGDGIPDYVWYGGDDTGQRLLWFLSKDQLYECVNVFESAEIAWKKKFGRAAPDLGAVSDEHQVYWVTWDRNTQLLSVGVVNNDSHTGKTYRVKLTIPPAEFIVGKR